MTRRFTAALKTSRPVGRPTTRTPCDRCGLFKRLYAGVCWRCRMGTPERLGLCERCRYRYAREGGRCRRCQTTEQKAALIPEGRRCTRCEYRWAQGPDGFCRHCAKVEAALVAEVLPDTRELEAERIARRRARIAALVPVVLPPRMVDIVVDGVAYEAVDLAVRTLEPGELERALAEARGIPQRGIW